MGCGRAAEEGGRKREEVELRSEVEVRLTSQYSMMRIEIVRTGIWLIRLARTSICGPFGAHLR